MTEKELIKKLSALKNVEVDQSWVKKNRDVLSYQIFNGAEYVDEPLSFIEKFSLITKRVLQPTPIAILIAVFFVASGAAGVKMSRNATPGEPLYIAKTLSEKVQSVATFDETAKAKLSLEFATERVIEIEKVVNQDPSNNNDKVQELTNSFKNEISSARGRLAKIKSTRKTVNSQTANKEDKSDVVSAGTNKDEKGIEISAPDNEKVLQEAEKLFNDKNYKEAAAKLDELGEQLK